MTEANTHHPKDKTPKRILIVRLSAHGDTVQTLPLLNALKEKDPHCLIGWLTETAAAPLLENHPLIDHLHVANRKKWLKNPSLSSLSEFTRLVNSLKSVHYDVSIDVQGLLKSAVWPKLAGINTRWGNKDARENATWFYTHTLNPHRITDKDTPAILRYTEFADALYHPVSLTSWPLPEDKKQEKLNQIQFSLPKVTTDTQQRIQVLLSSVKKDQPTIAIAPSTMWQSKHWPEQYWQELLQLVLNKISCNLLILGTPADQALNNRIMTPALKQKKRNLIDLTGKTQLGDLYALLQHLDIFIGSDSALLHIADAVSHTQASPYIIGLYGPTSPNRTGPIQNRHTPISTSLDCQPCFKRICPLQTDACMKELAPIQVLEAIEQQLTLVQAHQGTSIQKELD